MKVLFNTYPMAFHTPGGGEIQLLAYRDHLPLHGVEVTLFDLWNPRFLDHDLVHFFSCLGGSYHYCAFVKQIGLPLVVSSSLWITEESSHLYPVGEIRRQFSLADRVVANSDIECETLSRVLDLPRERFVTVYNGVDDLFFEPCSPDIFRDHFRVEQQFILNVGNIEPRKNQLLLIEAMKEFPDLKLVLMGHVRDPLYGEECLRAGGEQVRYVGPVPHDSPLLRSAYAACEAFALPSTLETPGLAALEAATLGCRIIVTEEGSAAEYFGDSAWYVNPISVESLREGLEAAVTAGRGKQTGTFVAENYRWRFVTGKLSGVYAELLGKRTQPQLLSPVDFGSLSLSRPSKPIRRAMASTACNQGPVDFQAAVCQSGALRGSGFSGISATTRGKRRMDRAKIGLSPSEVRRESIDLAVVIPLLEKYGGAERYLIECIRHWQDRHRITLYATKINEELLVEHGIGDQVQRALLRGYFEGEHSMLLNALLLPKIWREEVGRHDLYHTHLWPTHMIDLHPMVWFPHEPLRILHDLRYEQPVEISSQSSGIRVVHTYPKFYYDNIDEHLYRSYLSAIDAMDKASKPDRIIANSSFTAQYLEELYQVPVKDVVYPGVEPGLFVDLPVDPNLFVTIGQLWFHKRIHLLIEAIALTDDTQLAIIGSGPEEGRLQDLCRRLGIDDRVFFVSGLTNRELGLLLARACAFLFAPIKEPFGIVLLEAMAAGKPVIAAEEGGYVEICDPSFSFLLPPFPAAFAEKIAYLQQNPRIARAMGSEGRRKAAAYTWVRTAEQLEEMLLDTWKRARSHAEVTETGEERKTLFGAQYYLWYGDGFGEAHWNDNPRTGYVNDKPFLGYYSSSKGQTIEYHLGLFADMGLDYAILNLHVDDRGPNYLEFRGIEHVFEIAQKTKSPLKFAVQIAPYTENLGVIEEALRLLRKEFLKHPNYLRLDGVPVLFWFWTGAYDGNRNLFTLIAGTGEPLTNVAMSLRLPGGADEQKLTFEFFRGFAPFSPLELSEEKKWLGVWSSAYRAADKAGMAYRIATVSPGYDDRGLKDELRIRNPHRFVPRRKGATYRTCMRWVEKLDKAPHLVVISTFNEFHENTHIEPTLRHGTDYVQMTKEFVERMKHRRTGA